jgi:hypothetical protein
MSILGRQSAAKRSARLSLVAGVVGAAVLSGMTLGVSTVTGAATAVTAKTGGIEVCKYAGDTQVHGTFNYQLTATNWSATLVVAAATSRRQSAQSR